MHIDIIYILWISARSILHRICFVCADSSFEKQLSCSLTQLRKWDNASLEMSSRPETVGDASFLVNHTSSSTNTADVSNKVNSDSVVWTNISTLCTAEVSNCLQRPLSPLHASLQPAMMSEILYKAAQFYFF